MPSDVLQIFCASGIGVACAHERRQRVIEAIERGPVLHKEIQLRIRRYIAEQQLQPGDRLPGEEALSVQLGVGRPALREALKGLEAVGLVESRRGAGNFVAQFDPARYMEYFAGTALAEALSVPELTEVRSLLEVAWVKDAVIRLTPDDIEELKAAWEKMKAHAAEKQPYRWDDFDIHRIIMRHVPNRLIPAILDALFTLYEFHPVSRSFRAEQVQLDLEQHEMLINAVIAGDGEAAQEALIISFDKAATNFGFAIGWGDLTRHPAINE
jgi:GntR family transcriptional repressor for pyruvate dehydrogenase complex